MTRQRVYQRKSRPPAPVILGRAIYLGSRPTARLTLRGRIVERRSGLRTIRTGSTVYVWGPALVVPSDFSIASFRGRPVVQVDHAGHLLALMRRHCGGKPQFYCLIDAFWRETFDDWLEESRPWSMRRPRYLCPLPLHAVPVAWMIA